MMVGTNTSESAICDVEWVVMVVGAGDDHRWLVLSNRSSSSKGYPSEWIGDGDGEDDSVRAVSLDATADSSFTTYTKSSWNSKYCGSSLSGPTSS